MIYEYMDENKKVDENTLVVDFNFTADVSQQEAIELIDKMVSMLDDSTDAIAKEFKSHKPFMFVLSPFI